MCLFILPHSNLSPYTALETRNVLAGPRVCSILCMGYTLLLSASARLQFDEQLVNIKRRVAVNICLGRYPVVARRCLASYTPRLAELQLQVEGGNVGPNVGSAATPPSRLFTPSGAAAQLRCGAGFSEPVQRYKYICIQRVVCYCYLTLSSTKS